MKYLFRLLFFIPLLSISQSDFDKAEMLFRQGNYTQSQILLQAVIRENPSDLKALEYLGDCNALAGKWEQALVFYKRLKTARPSIANYYYKYGGVMAMIAKDANQFRALGMLAGIRQAFEKTIALDPDHTDARWALVEYYLQVPGIFGGSEQKAAAYANELLQISPVDGHLAKGRISEYFKRYAAAEQHYKNAIATGGSKTTYQKLASLYKNKMNLPEKAKAILAEFSEKNKTS